MIPDTLFLSRSQRSGKHSGRSARLLRAPLPPAAARQTPLRWERRRSGGRNKTGAGAGAAPRRLPSCQLLWASAAAGPRSTRRRLRCPRQPISRRRRRPLLPPARALQSLRRSPTPAAPPAPTAKRCVTYADSTTPGSVPFRAGPPAQSPAPWVTSKGYLGLPGRV